MLPATSPRKKLRSLGQDTPHNPKTIITCTNVPESLFEPNAASKHFSKFGKILKIRLFLKKRACLIEYEQPSAVERAVLNAGAYDGFMFDVTRAKTRVRKRSRREDDPDWVPDSDVAQELSAMRGAPTYNTRRKSMEVEPDKASPPKPLKRVVQQTVRKMPVRKSQPIVRPAQPTVRQAQPAPVQPASGTESPVIFTTQTTMTTFEAALELHQLRSKISLSFDEQWRTLDARDRILRSWGGAGSRVKVGGATIGTCQDMCPEKELLHRQAEHQVMLLETDSEGVLEPRRAVKQYSRSSADQEIPMCYELRPASVLMRTCAYLLHEVADTTRQDDQERNSDTTSKQPYMRANGEANISLADWFHFMWDRLRGIRKDITQQAMCCAESICLVEMCARFHAHCAARLADLEHTQFDQKLNTDNLTKCLQTLKHMYTDVTAEKKPREAEFRGYIALLNLGDANFWWEIKQLPEEIQKSAPLTFAIKVFNALDNNNYVRFFRLVREEATYLQACILLRYFNDVRARALARIVKAYAPRGGSRFPASDLVSALAFESIDKMKAFINHYGLRFAKADDYELSVILDRNQFIEDSDPFATARAIQLIESKRENSVGQVIAGGQLPNVDYFSNDLHKSFTKEGRLKETALVAEEQGFNTVNDSNKNVQALKTEIQRLAKGGKAYTEATDTKTIFAKPEVKISPKRKATTVAPVVSDSKLFTFKPAITVAPIEVIENSPEKIFDSKDNVFSFSQPQVTEKAASFFTPPTAKSTALFSKTLSEPKNLFGRTTHSDKAPFQNAQNAFAGTNDNVFTKSETSKFGLGGASKPNDLFTKPEMPKSAFGVTKVSDNLFSKPEPSIFGQNVEDKQENPFGGTKPNNRLFSKPEIPKSVFGQNVAETKKESVFATKPNNLFSNPDIPKPLFGQNALKDKQESILSTGTKPADNLFSKPDVPKSVFGQNIVQRQEESSQSVFGIRPPPITNNTENNATFNKNIFASAKNDLSMSKPDSATQFGKGSNLFTKTVSNHKESHENSLFTNSMKNVGEPRSTNIFAKPAPVHGESSQGSNLFAQHVQNSGETKKTNNIFAKPAPADEPKPSSIFGVVNKPESKNIFSQPGVIAEQYPPSTFASNGDVPADNTSPGSLFKSAVNPPDSSDAKGYSIFQSKNKAQTVADNIFNSLNAAKNDTMSNVYEFNQNTEIDEQNQLELQRLREEEIKQEQERQRQEKIRKEEERRQAELRKQEEERRKAEEKRKQEELRRLEEKRRLEEQRKQEELRKKLEEERKAELKRKAEEEHRKLIEAVDRESRQLVEELITKVNDETSREVLQEEQESYRQLLELTGVTTEEVMTELCNEICYSEIKAEVFLTRSIMRKWFDMWRRQFIRNITRRKWLEDTPVWLPNRSPIEQALHLRRKVEDAALQNMNAFHRGYRFSGELKQLPPPEPYNIMELIRSPLLKRMKQISYPYDKCFFWKVTLVSPGENQWLCRKINVEKWLHDAFSDKKNHEESGTLLQVSKQSWNHLMDFAISVSLAKRENMGTCADAVEGTNGILFYSTEKDSNLLKTIEQTLKNKYPYQIIPVAVIIPKQDDATNNDLQAFLAEYVNRKIISGYKVFVLDPKNINSLLYASTKSALKWMAKKYPQIPPLEIDFLKSICQRYLGNEIWCRFRSERDSRMGDVLKDLQKLINCYNVSVDKLTDVITKEDLFNYTSFPLELKPYLEQASPYPKSYEFIPSNVRTSENISTIRDIMKQLKLPNSLSPFRPHSAVSMQQQIRTYCNQIGCFEDPEEVVCRIVAVLPNELSDLRVPCEDFTQYFAHYDLIDFLNVIIYEKINRLYNFDNRFAIYEKSVLQEYCSINWLYGVKAISEMKHKVIEYEDDVSTFIEAKRRKLAMDSLEYLMLEDKDSTLVEASIQEAEADITKYSDCSEAVKQLEKEIEEGTKKSVEFENMLRAALADV